MPPIVKRKKNVLTLGEKIKILDKLRAGESFASVSRIYKINESTVRSIKAKEDFIRDSVATSSAASSKRVSQIRNKVLEETEKALGIWIEDMSQKRVPLSSALIRAKAKKLYDKINETSHSDFDFQASKGWFENFKKRLNLHNIKLLGESASADHEEANKFPATLQEIIEARGYSPQQVFNADETGLFWKKMPNRTFLSKSERTAPGFKVAKDRVSLLLCANASGDCKIKPMMIYRSQNPRALKGKNKEQLPIFWRANSKAWVTSALFQDWFQSCFINEVKTYLASQNLAFKVLLLIDNAPGHPSSLIGTSPNVEVFFLPPNTTSLIQPLDQGVIAAFKAYYTRHSFKRILNSIECNSEETITSSWKKFTIADCIADIDASWQEMKPSSINACWRKIWPQVVEKDNLVPPITNEEDEIVRLAHQIGGEGFEDMQRDEVNELLNSHGEELSEEDLLAQKDQETYETEEVEEMSSETVGKFLRTFLFNLISCKVLYAEKSFSSNHLREILILKDQLVQKAIDLDPSLNRSLQFKRDVEAASNPYVEIFKERKNSAKQRSIKSYFLPSTSTEENQ